MEPAAARGTSPGRCRRAGHVHEQYIKRCPAPLLTRIGDQQAVGDGYALALQSVANRSCNGRVVFEQQHLHG
jgi:hypothetical protein